MNLEVSLIRKWTASLKIDRHDLALFLFFVIVLFLSEEKFLPTVFGILYPINAFPSSCKIEEISCENTGDFEIRMLLQSWFKPNLLRYVAYITNSRA